MAKRNYKREYAQFYGTKHKMTPAQRKRRKEKSARNMIRRRFEKLGLVKRFDGMDIDHIDHNPLNGSMKNLRIVHRSINRAKNHD